MDNETRECLECDAAMLAEFFRALNAGEDSCVMHALRHLAESAGVTIPHGR